MNLDEQVVKAIFNELFVDNAKRYQHSLRQPVALNEGNDIFAQARQALTALSDAEKDTVLKFIDVVIADTASTIFGTLDGTHFPNDIDGDFTLTYKNDEIQGSLQDIFIALTEEKAG